MSQKNEKLKTVTFQISNIETWLNDSPCPDPKVKGLVTCTEKDNEWVLSQEQPKYNRTSWE